MPTVKDVDDMADAAMLLVGTLRREGFSDATPDGVTAALARLDSLKAEIEDLFHALGARKHARKVAADINGVTLAEAN